MHRLPTWTLCVRAWCICVRTVTTVQSHVAREKPIHTFNERSKTRQRTNEPIRWNGSCAQTTSVMGRIIRRFHCVRLFAASVVRSFAIHFFFVRCLCTACLLPAPPVWSSSSALVINSRPHTHARSHTHSRSIFVRAKGFVFSNSTRTHTHRFTIHFRFVRSYSLLLLDSYIISLQFSLSLYTFRVAYRAFHILVYAFA